MKAHISVAICRSPKLTLSLGGHGRMGTMGWGSAKDRPWQPLGRGRREGGLEKGQAPLEATQRALSPWTSGSKLQGSAHVGHSGMFVGKVTPAGIHGPREPRGGWSVRRALAGPGKLGEHGTSGQGWDTEGQGGTRTRVLPQDPLPSRFPLLNALFSKPPPS